MCRAVRLLTFFPQNSPRETEHTYYRSSLFKGQEFLTLEDGTDMLSRDVVKELPLDVS
jgi:hypothetical protein